MKFFLRLRHWQLFMLTWGSVILMDLIAPTHPDLPVKLSSAMMIFFILWVFGWVWAIATVLQGHLPDGVQLNVKPFKVYFALLVIYYVTEAAGFSLSFLPVKIIFDLLSIVFTAMGLRFAAKTMRSVELGRLAKAQDYKGEFFLLYCSPIGVWIIQPRLNKLVQRETSIQ